MKKSYARERYDRLKAQGICVVCAETMVEKEGSVKCEKCKAFERQKYRVEVERCLEEGICVKCKCVNDKPGYKYCSTCMKEHNEMSKKRVQKRKRKHVCVYCGKKPPVGKTQYCKECKEKILKRNKINRDKGWY